MPEDQDVAHERMLRQGGDRMLREASAYLAGGGQLRDTLQRLVERLGLEIITTSEYPGDGLPKLVAFPDPTAPGATVEIEDVHVVALEKLIELKLASGLSAPHHLRDLADVQDLIVRLELPLDLIDQLDASVQAAFRDLWQKAQVR